MTRILAAVALVLFSMNAFGSEPINWSVGFQPPATDIMSDIEDLYRYFMIILFAIVGLILFLLMYVCIRFNVKTNPIPNKFSHNVVIEVLWTVVPTILIVAMAIPSLKLLRKVETIPENVDLTIKVVGYQWYWHYDYVDNGGFGFDSYIIPDDKLKVGEKRLLSVDNNLVIPVDKVVKFIITSGDVIHSFAVPSFGFKVDAVPGRINETWVKVNKTGMYYGQCSELCGVNHGFMPIAVKVVTEDEFKQWTDTAKSKFSYTAPNKLNKIAILGSYQR